MQDFEWDDLKIFLAVARGKSVRSGAKLLNVSHSTVSRRLSTMETALGARLFDRRPEGYFPTGIGEGILPRAEKVESELLQLQTEVFGRDARLAGPIRITMSPLFAQRLIMPSLRVFSDRYPDVELEVISTYSLSDMSRRSADIAVRFQESPDPFLFGRRLPAFGDSIYATRDYLTRNDPHAPNTTARWLGWGDGERSPAWIRDTPFPDVPVGHDCPEPLAQLEAARAGLGMAVLPCLLGDPDPDVVRVPGVEVYKERQGWVLTHPDLKTTERVRVCVRFLVETVQAQKDLVTGQLPARGLS